MNSSPFLRINEVGTNGDFWDTARRKGHDYPEQDLLLAVLKDARLHYRRSLRRPGKTFQAERDWFFSTDTERLFSFQSVCDALNLSAERIRQHLLAWERYSLSAYKPSR